MNLTCRKSGGHELADLFAWPSRRLEACSTRAYGPSPPTTPTWSTGSGGTTRTRVACGRNRSFRTTRQTELVAWGSWYKQTAAAGLYGDGTLDGDLQVEDTGYFDWSRSGHLSTLYARTRHSTTWFPRGSVQRVTPRATQRPAADEMLPSATRRQRGGGRIASVTLYYKPEATAWPRPHVLAGGVYSARIPGQADATEVLFYLQVVTNDEDQQTIYEPYGSAESDPPTLSGIPDDDERPGTGTPRWSRDRPITSTSRAHRALRPRPAGTDLEDYDDEKQTGLKRCTGRWEMKPWTNIKPGLINVARFRLDRLGDDFEFNPSDRPGAGCCWPMPIKWRGRGQPAGPVPRRRQNRREPADQHRGRD